MDKRLKTCDTSVLNLINNSTSRTVNFNQLDDSCLVRILTHLPIREKVEAEKVCKRWKNISMTKIWQNNTHLDLTNGSIMLKTEFNGQPPTLTDLQRVIIRCGKFLKSIKFGKFYNSAVLNIIRCNCPHLLSLELDLSSYLPNDFVDVFSRMKNLEVLKIFSTFDNSAFKFFSGLGSSIRDIYLDARNDSGKVPSFQNFNSLRSLTMNGFYIDMKTVGDISQMKNLKNLSLRYCTIKENVQMRQIFFLKYLEKLDFFNMKPEYEGGLTVDDSLLSEIVYNLKNLKYLNVSGCDSITVNGVNLLIKLKKLEVLSIATLGLYSVKKKLRFGPFHQLKVLNCMGIYEISDLIIIPIIIDSPKLEKLIVSGTKTSVYLLERANQIKKKSTINVVLNIWTGDSIIQAYRESKVSKSKYLVVHSLI
ncbi:hypothetical protein HCN44_005983 [Aphidius gifuensis]|uniref:F-box domain-containing protein n=1 Tax=Aphidius gifuensis TaxID=684658 RepID=A0A835CVF8_APHGI|nr:uncharacterized protein LOC122850709 [Aphidius gifuensis]KAF7997412.1 hypothetical protein HCN44_005983 [Aphidius gifuensis]